MSVQRWASRCLFGGVQRWGCGRGKGRGWGLGGGLALALLRDDTIFGREGKAINRAGRGQPGLYEGMTQFWEGEGDVCPTVGVPLPFWGGCNVGAVVGARGGDGDWVGAWRLHCCGMTLTRGKPGT